MKIKQPYPKKSVVLTLVGIISVGCAYWIYSTYFGAQNTTVQETTANKSSFAVSSSNNSEPLLETISESNIILKRQLFGPSPGQSAFQDQASAPAPQTIIKDLDIVLMGTIGVSGNDGKAIILDKQENKQQIYQKGDAIRGIYIKDILRGRVLISQNGKDGYLEMNESMNYTPKMPQPAQRAVAPAQKAKRQATKTRGASSTPQKNATAE